MTQTTTTVSSYAVTPLVSPGNYTRVTDDAILVKVWSTPIAGEDSSIITATPGAGGTILVQFSFDSQVSWRNASATPYSSTFVGGVPPGVTAIRATAIGATATLVVDTPQSFVELTPNELTFVRPLVSGAGFPTAPIGRPTRLCLGDSLTQYNARLGLPITASSGVFGGWWTYLWAEWDCESGAGTLTYDATARTLRWTPLAGTPGLPVDASYSGMLRVPGGVAGHGIWIVWFAASYTYTSGTATVTVGANGTQVWVSQAAGQGGYGAWAQAYGRQALRLAPMPASCPPGMDGYYGMGGAVSADLLAASPQWLQIQADVVDLQIGSNDCNAGVAVATYLSNVQSIIARLLANGTRYVRWLTVPPRDTDTTAQRQWKAAAARSMMAYQQTTANRVHVVDVAGRVTDYASGANQGKWLTNYALDGIHPSTLGGMVMGRALAEVDRKMGVQGLYWGSVGDVYDATANPNGNILAAVSAGSGWMEGTSGTLSTGAGSVGAWAATTAYVLGQPVITGGRLYVATTAGTSSSTAPVHTAGQAADGTVVWQYIASGAVAGIATGWTASRSVGSNLVVACCKVARTDGVPGEWQYVITYGATANETAQIQTAASTTGFTVGGQYQLDSEWLHVRSSLLNSMGVQITVNGTSAAKQAQWGLYGTSGANLHADALADPNEPLVLSTPPAWPTVSASSTLRASAAFGIQSGGYAVMAVGRTQLRRTA